MNLIFSEDLPDFQFNLWARGEAKGIRHRWNASFMKYFLLCLIFLAMPHGWWVLSFWTRD